MTKILIIDDDNTVRSSLELILTRKNYAVKAINHPSIAVDTIAEYQPEVILLDMNFTIETTGRQGLKLLEKITEIYPSISVILMTGWATVQIAVEGMKLGAKDFIAKPWDNKNLLGSIANIVQLHHASSVTKSQPSGMIIGESEAIKQVMSMVDRVAPTEANVLITGESGTGKELIAEAIHESSSRKEGSFVKVNLGAIPSSLFESEMFGHRRGAFTGADADRIGRFAVADGGTIFLDEIGELTLDNQVKLLRVIQERTFEPLGSSKTHHIDVRIISATNRNLKQHAGEGKFREDLYYRINLINIHLPPLRDRRGDIPLLTKYFIRNIADLYSMDVPYLEEPLLDWLSAQEYKGNIRELKNIVERTCLLNLGKKELTKKELQPSFEENRIRIGKQLEFNLESIEIETITKALNKYGHSISAASKALGITRSSLYRRIEKYAIPYEPKI